MTVWEDELIYLRLDRHSLNIALTEHAGHIDLIVEVTNVAHNRVVLHGVHMLCSNDVFVASRGNEDVGSTEHIFEAHYLVTLHRRLQSTDRINLGHHYTGTLAAQ